MLPTRHLHDNTLVLLLEPGDGISLCYSVLDTDLGGADLAAGNTVAGAGQDDKEVHTEDTGGGIIFKTKIDVLGDTKSEASGVGEVLLLQLILLDLQASVKDLVGLETTDGHIHGDLLVSSDTEGTHSVSGLAVDGLLISELLQHLGGTGQSITSLTNATVDDQLVNLQLTHGVLSLLLSNRCHFHNTKFLKLCDLTNNTTSL
mgnify:CR=1